MISSYVSDDKDHREWGNCLPKLGFASANHEVTTHTPNYLNFGENGPKGNNLVNSWFYLKWLYLNWLFSVELSVDQWTWCFGHVVRVTFGTLVMIMFMVMVRLWFINITGAGLIFILYWIFINMCLKFEKAITTSKYGTTNYTNCMCNATIQWLY